jgi:hypothetical protein
MMRRPWYLILALLASVHAIEMEVDDPGERTRYAEILVRYLQD